MIPYALKPMKVEKRSCHSITFHRHERRRCTDVRLKGLVGTMFADVSENDRPISIPL